MGKGSIISGGTDGLYYVENQLYRDRLNSIINRINNRIAELNARLYISGTTINPDLTEAEKNDLYAQLAALNTRLRTLQSLPEDEISQIWCADLTEDLSGTVGLAEIAYQEDLGLNIVPGYASGTASSPAIYDQERDGQFGNGIGNTPFATYYNWVMLPFAQRYRPRYRYGTISEIDYEADTCTVTLESVFSRAQGIDVTTKPNESNILTGVQVEYMNCDAAAFQDGDVVLVKFENFDWDSPKVIGFKDNPKPCGAGAWVSGGYVSGTTVSPLDFLIDKGFPTIFTTPPFDLVVESYFWYAHTYEFEGVEFIYYSYNELPFGTHDVEFEEVPTTEAGKLYQTVCVSPLRSIGILSGTRLKIIDKNGVTYFDQTGPLLYNDISQTGYGEADANRIKAAWEAAKTEGDDITDYFPNGVQFYDDFSPPILTYSDINNMIGGQIIVESG